LNLLLIGYDITDANINHFKIMIQVLYTFYKKMSSAAYELPSFCFTLFYMDFLIISTKRKGRRFWKNQKTATKC